MNKPKVVCLCGSTRFYDAFQKANYKETMKGNIVLSVGFYSHSQTEAHGEEVGCTKEQKRMLDELHKRKIDLADEVLVLNVGGYIGESTKSEIEYAMQTYLEIKYLEPNNLPIEPEQVYDIIIPEYIKSDHAEYKKEVKNNITGPVTVTDKHDEDDVWSVKNVKPPQITFLCPESWLNVKA